MSQTLFPITLPERTWLEFVADGFTEPVTGVIHRGANPPDCGMPLGGIDTGCLDLEATGLLGLNSIFNSLVDPSGPLNVPFLGLSLNQQSWVLTTLNLPGRDGYMLLDHPRQYYYKGIRTAQEIHYWGHYPVADLEYITDAPVSVGLRAWSPLIPGDVAASNIPGAVFEVRLRNPSAAPQTGTLAFTFPGPTESEAQTTQFRRLPIHGPCTGVAVMAEKVSYALAVIGRHADRVGGDLGVNGASWAKIARTLPAATQQAGASLAIDFTLAPGEQTTIRFVLAWYCPEWLGGGTMSAGGNAYRHMYARRYYSVIDVAQFLALNHASLLPRILAWQNVIYADKGLPGWLQDTLINVLHLITETSVWAQATSPIGEWCRPEDGLFAMNESPRWCPQMECIPCSFYGNLPLVYFFPELALSTLRGYKAYQSPNGAAPWVFGGCTTGTPPYELALPSPGYAHKPMTTLDGACYVDMVDRLWLCTGDHDLLREFYLSVKKNTIFTMNLRPGSGPAGIVSMPKDNLAQDWVESCDLFGIVPHIGGVHLAQLRMAQRMAEAMQDDAFARQCQEWLEQGSAVLEGQTWDGSHYLLFHEVETGKRSDIILSCLLDGEWMALFHGLPNVFQPERVKTTLATIQQTSVALSNSGAVVFCKPAATLLGEGDWDPGYWGVQGVFPPATFILAMTYIYQGARQVGLDLARRCVAEVLRRGWIYDWPVVIDSAMGPRVGFDYYQNLILWSLPAVLADGDLSGPSKSGGLVNRIIQAGQAYLNRNFAQSALLRTPNEGD